MNRLPELVSKIETEFPDRVNVQAPDLTLEDGEAAVYFEPVNASSAPLLVRYWFGVYSIEYAEVFGLDSDAYVPADEGFEWALDQALRVARFGLVFISTRRFFGLLPDSMYLVPSHPQGGPAFEEELQREVRPVIQRTWDPW